jgi:hypothetical protein
MKKSPQSAAPQPRTRPRNAQRNRFIEAAREAGCSEDEAEIRDNMKRLVKATPPREKSKQ